ncbi:MAG: peroxide stress protein YaaA [Flavobacteriales bacterium]
MKLLLSPAKKLDYDSPLPDLNWSKPVFEENANYLAEKLNKSSAKKISSMMHLSEALTQLNVQRYAEWKNAAQRPAALAFNGDVYTGLDAYNWSKKELEHSQSVIRILSGIYGILKPLDLIKPYRLEMGSKWAVTPTKSNLYKYWGKTIATQLEKEMEDNEPIVNLASAEYNKVILKQLSKGRKVVTVEFKDFKNGELKMIQIFVKRARGMMAKYIAKENITEIKDLIKFNEDGYVFDANLSSESKMVFTR